MVKTISIIIKYITIIGGLIVVSSVYILSGDFLSALLGYGVGVGCVSLFGKLFQG